MDNGWTDAPKLNSHPSIDLVRVPNVGSCRKFLFTLDRFRDAGSFIILIDDDRAWRREVFRHLVEFVNERDSVAVTRGWSQYTLSRGQDGLEILRDKPIRSNVVLQPMPCLLLVAVGICV